MPVGELFLSAFLQVLFDRLTSPELLQFATWEGIQSKFKKWEKTFKIIDAMLIDAEEKQLTDRAVKMWLDDLQDLAYDVEDILDEFATEALRRKLTAEDGASTSKVRNFVPSCCTGLTPSTVKFNISMGSKIHGITSRLEELCKQRIELGLEKIAGRTTAVWRRPLSTCVPPEPAVIGRDEDKAKILELVLRDEPSVANFRVIPIVGMGGLGKTTLARQVFNDKAVEDFNPRAWVCVSDDFDVLRISNALLESITSESCGLKDLNAVQVKLKNALAGKRFLLVLDDVWNEDYGLWETLKSPFMAGAPGSKIIITTRSEYVALTMEQSDYYNLKRLTDESCWHIFKSHVSGNRVIAVGRNLKLIHEKVVERCGGLALTARTLGGLLRTKQRDDEWENILNSKIWDLSNDILPVLKLSYHHLPSYLKRCFAYCAIFPKDYEFEEQEVILLWLAEGLIQQEENMLEDLGREYFRDLLSRSIFQQSTSNVSKFVMHDLVNDLAQLTSRYTSFISENELVVHLPSERLKRTRHFSYTPGEYEVKNKFEVIYKVKHLRTFLPLWKSTPRHLRSPRTYTPSTAFSDLLLNLKKLRVLSLANYCITKLPNSIGGLTLLRYLDLSYTMMRSLPESINSLYNLQILILRRCTRLRKLPFNMGNLIGLHYLDISESSLIKEMPLGIGKMKCLRTLSNFIVGKDRGSCLKELSNLKFLSESLIISSLENMVDSQHTRETILSDKKDLKVLVLRWSPDLNSSRDLFAEENVLDMLQPHTNLEELTVNNYGGQKFPSWIGDPSLSNIKVLELDGCVNCTTLPSLGLLGSLEKLTIKNMKKLKRIGSEICGGYYSKSFQLLKTLCFENLPQWEQWDPTDENEHIERFPHLIALSISKCPKLSGRLPSCCLPLLESLVIYECEQLVVSISELPMLRSLILRRCKGMACGNPVHSENGEKLNFPVFKNWSSQAFIKLESLTGLGCGELVHLWPNDIFPGKSPQGLHNFISIKELHLIDLPNLVSVPDGLLSIPSTLTVSKCNALASLHEGLKHNNPHLEYLSISGCPSLTCIVRGHLPSSLKELWIVYCENLLCVVGDREDACGTSSPSSSSSSVVHKEDVDYTTTSFLYSLYIEDCPSLTCLSSTDKPLPTTLACLEIWHCSNLKTLLPRGQLYKALQSISIGGCPKLESIVERFDNNTSLKIIYIDNCENLKSIPEGLHTVSSLRDIRISDCSSFLLFPEGGLPNAPYLTISIENCEKLQALPDRMHSLNSLQRLSICNCPSIVYTTNEDLTTSLTSLEVTDVNFYRYLTKWGFHKLSSLRSLSINRCTNAVCFPQEDVGMILPSSLSHLTIVNLPKLKYLFPNGFQIPSSLVSLRINNCPHLTSLPIPPSSLQSLYIFRCPNITSLPGLPRSLQTLSVKDCPNITSLPSLPLSLQILYVDGCPNITSLPSLPSSLLQLSIMGCPMLKKQCKKDERKEWSKIVDVPYVRIDEKLIYEEEE